MGEVRSGKKTKPGEGTERVAALEEWEQSERPCENWKGSVPAEGTAKAMAVRMTSVAGLGSGWVSVRRAGGAGGSVGAAPGSAAFS